LYFLKNFDKIMYKLYRKLWLEQQGGTRIDNQRLTEIARMKAEHDLPDAPVTASDVKKMIRQEKAESSATTTITG
jgi:hypothetical protein